MNEVKVIQEAIEIKPWLFRVRGSNRHIWYEVTHRRDETFHCTCKGFRFNDGECKHIEIVKAMVE